MIVLGSLGRSRLGLSLRRSTFVSANSLRRLLTMSSPVAGVKRKAGDISTPDSSSKKPKANASITSFFGAPKPKTDAAVKSTITGPNHVAKTTSTSTSGTAPISAFSQLGSTSSASAAAPTKPFNKETWLASLTAEQKSLLALEINTLDESWLRLLKDEITKPDFLSLKRFLASEVTSGKKVFPPSGDVYSWSRHTPFEKVKVVILGQDPYHNVNQAHGLCFSVRPPTVPPPSLANIFKLLEKEYPPGCAEGAFKRPPNNGGLLTPWADRGVLLLNTCLTVRAHEANSHAKKGWEAFTQKVIDIVAKKAEGVVFLAWGKPAQERTKAIKKNSKHLVLESVHPSPLSAARGYFDCAHFTKTNEWLRGRYGKDGGVDWRLDVEPEEAGV